MKRNRVCHSFAIASTAALHVLINNNGCLGFQASTYRYRQEGIAIDSTAAPPLLRLHRNLIRLRRVPSATLPPTSTSLRARGPKGYDDEYFRRKRKRLRGRGRGLLFFLPSKISVQKILVGMNVVFFLVQMYSASKYAPILNSVLQKTGYDGPRLDSTDMVQRMVAGTSPLAVAGRARSAPGSPLPRYGQALIVASSVGPFTMDFVHQMLLSRFQPHRFVTAGFLHGSLLHLLFNMRYLWTTPKWLEEGLGWPLYFSTYLVSIVAGNLAHSYVNSSGASAIILSLGASGGICGLQGLSWIALRRMGNKSASSSVFTNMIWLILFGAMTEGISNAGHIGGFIGGALIGWLFGPQYGSSYAMKRKWSTAVDTETQEYRSMMGFGLEPQRGKLKLWYLWAFAAIAFLGIPELRSIPLCVWLGFTRPGSLSGMRMNPIPPT